MLSNIYYIIITCNSCLAHTPIHTFNVINFLLIVDWLEFIHLIANIYRFFLQSLFGVFSPAWQHFTDWKKQKFILVFFEEFCSWESWSFVCIYNTSYSISGYRLNIYTSVIRFSCNIFICILCTEYRSHPIEVLQKRK